MDIIAASNIGMTNAYKDKKIKKQKAEHNKLYILAEIKYTVNGILGNNKVALTICNAQRLIQMAQKYYEERKLKNNKKWGEIDIKNLKIKDAIAILTKRKYAQISEIDEDKIGKKIINNKVACLTCIDVSDLQHKGV